MNSLTSPIVFSEPTPRRLIKAITAAQSTSEASTKARSKQLIARGGALRELTNTAAGNKENAAPGGTGLGAKRHSASRSKVVASPWSNDRLSHSCRSKYSTPGPGSQQAPRVSAHHMQECGSGLGATQGPSIIRLRTHLAHNFTRVVSPS